MSSLKIRMKNKLIVLVLVLIGLVVFYGLVNQIVNTLKSGDRLEIAVEQLHKLESENKELKLKLGYANSADFIEQQARNELGLTKTGETVVVIPDQKIEQILGAKKVEIIRFPNWQGWLKVFIH